MDTDVGASFSVVKEPSSFSFWGAVGLSAFDRSFQRLSTLVGHNGVLMSEEVVK